MHAVIEDLVALRLDRRIICHSDPLHGLVVAAEAVTDMEAPRFRQASNILEALSPNALNHEYRLVREALLTWTKGDLVSARRMLAENLPNLTGQSALLTGFLAHMADFYMGDETGMLETGLLLVNLHPTMSRRAVGLSDGLASFALEECGHFSEAIESANRALSVNHDDVYALHAKVHALQCLHESKAAKAVIGSYANGWATAEPMRIHMWWHFALSLRKEGMLDQVLLCYDLEVRRQRQAMAWEDLDAVALLWRLDLLGSGDIPDLLTTRWQRLARSWEGYAADPSYIWNDLHAIMTFAKVGNDRLFNKVVEACRTRETPDFFYSVCEPLFLGLAAFAQGDNAATVKLLSPVLQRRQLRIGGSKVQQSVLHWTRDAAHSRLRDGKSHDLLNSHTHALPKEA